MVVAAPLVMTKPTVAGTAFMLSGPVWADVLAVKQNDTTSVHVRRYRRAGNQRLGDGRMAMQPARGVYALDTPPWRVEDVMARYVWAVDSLDADGYVAVFTEDATIDSNGSISKGHAAIRGIVTGLIQRRDANKAKGLPTANLYHVVSNVRISFPKPGEALHQSYWQTVRRDSDGKMTAAAMGRSEDRLVKRNGTWLIQSRTLTVFTD